AATSVAARSAVVLSSGRAVGAVFAGGPAATMFASVGANLAGAPSAMSCDASEGTALAVSLSVPDPDSTGALGAASGGATGAAARSVGTSFGAGKAATGTDTASPGAPRAGAPGPPGISGRMEGAGARAGAVSGSAGLASCS